MNYSPPAGSSVHSILQARTLEWLAVPSSRGSSWPRDQTHISYSPALEGWFFTTSTTMWGKCKENEHSRRVRWHGGGEEKKLSFFPEVWREEAKKAIVESSIDAGTSNFFFRVSLDYSWFTMLCHFRCTSDSTWISYIYIYSYIHSF